MNLCIFFDLLLRPFFPIRYFPVFTQFICFFLTSAINSSENFASNSISTNRAHNIRCSYLSRGIHTVSRLLHFSFLVLLASNRSLRRSIRLSITLLRKPKKIPTPVITNNTVTNLPSCVVGVRSP